MNEEHLIYLTDRWLFSVSDRRSVKTCLFVRKRIDHPRLILSDAKRIVKKVLKRVVHK